MTSLDKNKIVTILKYTAALGEIPGRPDLPPLSFRTFEVIVRKYHNGFWVNIQSIPESCTVKVALCYHPNIGKIKQSLGGLTQLIKVEKLDPAVTEEEDHLATIFLTAFSPTSQQPIPTTVSILAPVSLPMTEPRNTPSTSAATTSSLSPAIPPQTVTVDFPSKKGTSQQPIPTTVSILAPVSSPMTEPRSTPSTSAATTSSLSPAIPPQTVTVDVPSKKGKKRCATSTEKQAKKKTLKKNIYNDDLEKLLALEQICQKTLDGEFDNFEM